MFKKEKIIFLFLLLSFSYGLHAQTCDRDKIFYVGLGTGMSSFVGGDFGSRFAIRIESGYGSDYSYYSNNNYYYGRYDPDYYYNDEPSIFPLQFDIVFGAKPTDALAFEFSAGLRWHLNGHPDPEFETGIYNEMDYIDRYDYSTLMTFPLTASIKYYPFRSFKAQIPVYLTAGYSLMYTSEDVERVREFYDYNYYGYEYSLYEYPLARYSASRWLHGLIAGIGFTYNITDNMTGDIELAYSNYWSELKDGSPLAMFRTKNIGNISLNMRVFYSF